MQDWFGQLKWYMPHRRLSAAVPPQIIGPIATFLLPTFTVFQKNTTLSRLAYGNWFST